MYAHGYVQSLSMSCVCVLCSYVGWLVRHMKNPRDPEKAIVRSYCLRLMSGLIEQQVLGAMADSDSDNLEVLSVSGLVAGLCDYGEIGAADFELHPSVNGHIRSTIGVSATATRNGKAQPMSVSLRRALRASGMSVGVGSLNVLKRCRRINSPSLMINGWRRKVNSFCAVLGQGAVVGDGSPVVAYGKVLYFILTGASKLSKGPLQVRLHEREAAAPGDVEVHVKMQLFQPMPHGRSGLPLVDLNEPTEGWVRWSRVSYGVALAPADIMSHQSGGSGLFDSWRHVLQCSVPYYD